MIIRSHLTETEWSPKTLVWDRGELLDVTSGQRATTRGEKAGGKYVLTYRFNAGIALTHGGDQWWIAYETRGTKGVMFCNGKFQRELNRSYHCADAYGYPIALAVAPNNRVVLLHCPHEFNVLEIEDAESGKRLASGQTRSMEFHSRLSVSRDNRFVIDAGWFWHPWSDIWVFDLHEALRLGDFKECDVLTGKDILNNYDIDNACFLDSEHVVLSSSDYRVGFDRGSDDGLHEKQLGVWSLKERRWVSRVKLDEMTGPMMAWRNHVVSFYEHPKLIDTTTGKVVQRWTDIDSGKETGAASVEDPKTPVRAIDPEHGRFAVASEGKVSIVELMAPE